MEKQEINARIAKILGRDGDIEDLIAEIEEIKDNNAAFVRNGWKLAREETKSVREDAKADRIRQNRLIRNLVIAIIIQFLCAVGLLFGFSVWLF
jgi:nitrate reductase NapE component